MDRNDLIEWNPCDLLSHRQTPSIYVSNFNSIMTEGFRSISKVDRLAAPTVSPVLTDEDAGWDEVSASEQVAELKLGWLLVS